MKVLINFNDLRRVCFEYDAVDVRTDDGELIIKEICSKSDEVCVPKNCPLVLGERVRE